MYIYVLAIAWGAERAAAVHLTMFNEVHIEHFLITIFSTTK